MIRLANPHALLLLLCIPPLVFLHRRGQYPAVIAYSTIQELAALPPSYLVRLRRALPVLRVFVLILCIVALARPQWGVEATKVHKQGIAIDMVVDVSRSMEAWSDSATGARATVLRLSRRRCAFLCRGAMGCPGAMAT